jgi:hypothetical protein
MPADALDDDLIARPEVFQPGIVERLDDARERKGNMRALGSSTGKSFPT